MTSARTPMPVRVLAMAAALWVAMLVAAPWLASAAGGHGRAPELILAVYGLASQLCHQRPERSFWLWQTQMPVCARCTGIYVGAVLAAAVLVVGGQSRVRPVAHVRAALIVAALPALATLAYEWTAGDTPSNLLRAVSGVPLGFTVLWAIGALFRPPEVQSSYTSVP